MKFNARCLCGPRVRHVKSPIGAHLAMQTLDAHSKVGRADPTGTLPLQQKWSKELDARWISIKKMLPQAMSGFTNPVNMVSHSVLTGKGDPVQAFQNWLDQTLRTVVLGTNGAWLLPYVRQATDAGSLHARGASVPNTDTPSTDTLPKDRTHILQSLAIAELQGIMDAVSQQLVRAFANSMLTLKRKAAAAEMSTIIDKVGVQRSRMLVSFMTIRAYAAATLDGLRARGVKKVGLIPEARPRSTVVATDAKQSLAGMINVETAGDDLVCAECEDIAAEGPYYIDEAEALIPAHPNCRCMFMPADEEEYADFTGTEQPDVEDAFNPDQPRDKNGMWSGGGAVGSNIDPKSAEKWANGTASTAKSSPPPSLHGVAFTSWTPPHPDHWAGVSGQADINEPPLPELRPDTSYHKPDGTKYTVPGERLSSGVIMHEPDGRVWVTKPTNGFGGYKHSWPKGGVEEGLSPQANAIKEAYEETGLKARITGYAGDFKGDTSTTRMYHAVREGGTPHDKGWESEAVVLAKKEDLSSLLNRTRDRKIANTIPGVNLVKHAPYKKPFGGSAHDAVVAADAPRDNQIILRVGDDNWRGLLNFLKVHDDNTWNEELHPRDKDGKFAFANASGGTSTSDHPLAEHLDKVKGNSDERVAIRKELKTKTPGTPIYKQLQAEHNASFWKQHMALTKAGKTEKAADIAAKLDKYTKMYGHTNPLTSQPPKAAASTAKVAPKQPDMTAPKPIIASVLSKHTGSAGVEPIGKKPEVVGKMSDNGKINHPTEAATLVKVFKNTGAPSAVHYPAENKDAPSEQQFHSYTVTDPKEFKAMTDTLKKAGYDIHEQYSAKDGGKTYLGVKVQVGYAVNAAPKAAPIPMSSTTPEPGTPLSERMTPESELASKFTGYKDFKYQQGGKTHGYTVPDKHVEEFKAAAELNGVKLEGNAHEGGFHYFYANEGGKPEAPKAEDINGLKQSIKEFNSGLKPSEHIEYLGPNQSPSGNHELVAFNEQAKAAKALLEKHDITHEEEAKQPGSNKSITTYILHPDGKPAAAPKPELHYPQGDKMQSEQEGKTLATVLKKKGIDVKSSYPGDTHHIFNVAPEQAQEMHNHLANFNYQHEVQVEGKNAMFKIPKEANYEYNSQEVAQKTATQTAATSGNSDALKFADLKKIGEKMGSNKGGTYEDKLGQKYYVKEPKSEDHVKNELLAAKLYQLAGAKTLTYVPVEGGKHVATKLEALDKNNISKFNAGEKTEAQKDFGIHAWLANWDAAGTGSDNQGTLHGHTVTLDVGGSMKYRAQGTPKGDAFGSHVGETNTLRDPSKSPDAAALFGPMTNEQLHEAYSKVTNLSDVDIIKTVHSVYGKNEEADNLAEKLINRKADLAAQLADLPKPAIKVTATEAELTKAKKNAALQMQYTGHPTLAGHPESEALVKAFNQKYEGKTLTTPEELQGKINDFNKLKSDLSQHLSAAEKANAEKAATAAATAKAAKEAAEANSIKGQVKAEIKAKKASGVDFEVEALKGVGVSPHGGQYYMTKFAQMGIDMSKAQASAIEAYVGNHYKGLNKILRQGKGMDPAQVKFAKVLDTALSKMPEHVGYAQRGIKEDPGGKIFDAYASQVGNAVMETAFTSAGTDHKLWGVTTLHIESKHGANISALNSEGGGEVIFRPGTWFHVKKVNKATQEIWVEEI